jgi:hypothetical protein
MEGTMKNLISIAVILLLSSSITFAQDFCKGDFSYDGSVGAEDVEIFLQHFGRNEFNNPCPPDGPSPVPKTGQTSMNTLFDDGYYQKGVVWPAPRFTDNSDGTVTDNLTGLIWLKDANCMSTNYPTFFPPSSNGRVPWYPALAFIVGINDGTYPLCGEGYNDWRLPNYRELFSLVDVQNIFPSIPSGDPFNNVQTGGYWSSTTGVHDPSVAWYVDMGFGKVDYDNKGSNYSFYVWPVRGGR